MMNQSIDPIPAFSVCAASDRFVSRERKIWISSGVAWFLSLLDTDPFRLATNVAEVKTGDVFLLLPTEEYSDKFLRSVFTIYIVNPIDNIAKYITKIRKNARFSLAHDGWMRTLACHGLSVDALPSSPEILVEKIHTLVNADVKGIALDNIPEETIQPLSVLLLMDQIGIGGMENVLLNLTQHMQARGWHPLIGYMDSISPHMEKKIRLLGIPCCHLSRDTEEQLAFCKKEGIQCINAHYSLEMTEAAAQLGIPCIQTVHNMYIWNDGADLDFWRFSYTNMDGFLCVSDACARVIEERYWVPKEKIHVIENGVPVLSPPKQTTQALRQHLGIRPDTFIFLNMATLSPIKKQDVLVSAFAQAFSHDENVALILLGNPVSASFSQKIQSMIDQYGLARKVFVAGFHEPVSQWLEMADSFVLPSVVEGWSLALDEARSCGLPLIATAVGGAPEQLDSAADILLPSYFSEDDTFASCVFSRIVEDREADSRVAKALADALWHHFVSVVRGEPIKRSSPLSNDVVFSRHCAYIYSCWDKKQVRIQQNMKEV